MAIVTVLATLLSEPTTAQRARLTAIKQIVLHIPELARPEGFEVVPIVGAGGGEPEGDIVPQYYELLFFVPTKAIAGEGMIRLEVIVNPVPDWLFLWGQPSSMLDQQGDRRYVEHPFGEKEPGALLGYGVLFPTERS